jgi:hypothetical protein
MTTQEKLKLAIELLSEIACELKQASVESLNPGTLQPLTVDCGSGMYLFPNNHLAVDFALYQNLGLQFERIGPAQAWFVLPESPEAQTVCNH